MRTCLAVFGVGLVAALAACSDRDPAPAPPSAHAPAPNPASTDAEPVAVVAVSDSTEFPEAHHFDDVVSAWKKWKNVYSTLRAAPEMCMLPRGYRTSDADMGSPHGRKVYELKVSDLGAFKDCPSAEPPIGFTAVKVAYAPNTESPSQPGDFIGLFIMKRIAEASDASTDQGWLYATTDADLQITSAGRVASCTECHADAPYGRLFGPLEEKNVTSYPSGD